MYFRQSELRDDKIQCTKIGFLYKDDLSTKISKLDYTYWFLHKTFQEYFAAYYCVYLETEIDVSKLSLYESRSGVKFIQVLKFMSYILQEKNAEDDQKFIEELGSYIYSQCEIYKRHEVVGILCAVLSENKLIKDIAGIVNTYLRKGLNYRSGERYFLSFIETIPDIFNCLAEGKDDETSALPDLGFKVV